MATTKSDMISSPFFTVQRLLSHAAKVHYVMNKWRIEEIYPIATVLDYPPMYTTPLNRIPGIIGYEIDMNGVTMEDGYMTILVDFMNLDTSIIILWSVVDNMEVSTAFPIWDLPYIAIFE